MFVYGFCFNSSLLLFFFFPRTVGDILIYLAAYYCATCIHRVCILWKMYFYVFILKEGQHYFHKLQENYRVRSHCIRSLTSSFSFQVIKCLIVGRRAVCSLCNAVKRKLICWWRLLGACFMFKSPGMFCLRQSCSLESTGWCWTIH